MPPFYHSKPSSIPIMFVLLLVLIPLRPCAPLKLPSSRRSLLKSFSFPFLSILSTVPYTTSSVPPALAEPSLISAPTPLLPNEELISSIFTAAAPSVVNIDTFQTKQPGGQANQVGIEQPLNR